MARRRTSPPAAHEEWTRDPPEVGPRGARCDDLAWWWKTWSTWGGVARFPRDVRCARTAGHPDRHSSRPRRSWLWHPRRWHTLRW